MIEIEIYGSKDSQRNTLFTTNKNLIYIGSNKNSDIYLPDDSIKSNHLFLEIVEDKLIIHPNKNIDFYLVNSKRTTIFKELKTGDILTIENIKFTIKNFIKTQYQETRDFLNSKTEELRKNDVEYLKEVARIKKLI